MDELVQAVLLDHRESEVGEESLREPRPILGAVTIQVREAVAVLVREGVLVLQETRSLGHRVERKREAQWVAVPGVFWHVASVAR